jgi:hypothetical protein
MRRKGGLLTRFSKLSDTPFARGFTEDLNPNNPKPNLSPIPDEPSPSYSSR